MSVLSWWSDLLGCDVVCLIPLTSGDLSLLNRVKYDSY